MSTVRPLPHGRQRRAASRAWRLRLDRFVLRVGVGAAAVTCEHAITRRGRHAAVQHGHASSGRAR